MRQKGRLYTGSGTRDFVEFDLEAGTPMGKMISTRQNAMASMFSIGNYLPNPDPVLRKMGKDITVYRDLLTDPRVGSNAENRQSGVLSQEWEIGRGQSKGKTANFVTDVLNDLPMNSIIEEILEAVLFGYKPMEVLWEKVGSFVIPTRIIGRPQQWFRFDSENHLRFIAKDALEGIDLDTPEYARKFLLPRRRATYENPYGDAVLARTFWYVAFKKGGLKFWITFTEKFGMPYLLGKYRQGASDGERETLLDSLTKMVQDAVAVVPDGDQVTALEFKTSGASAELYERLLRFCNEEATIALLGHPGSSQATPGKLGSDDTAMAVRQDLVDADKRIVEETINQLVKWIVEVNFGNSEPPEFGLYEEEDVDQDLAERDHKLADTGQVKFTKIYLQRAYGFKDDEIEVVEPDQTASFAEAVNTIPAGQQVVDDFAAGLPPALLQREAEKLLKPVIEFIQNAESFDEVTEKVAELYADMDDKDIQVLIERAIFLSDVIGKSETMEE